MRVTRYIIEKLIHIGGEIIGSGMELSAVFLLLIGSPDLFRPGRDLIDTDAGCIIDGV